MSKKNIILAVIAIVCVCSSTIERAWSYFTTYAEAKGGYTIQLGDETQIKEEFSAWVKQVSITNEEGSQPVYIRVKAFAGSLYQLRYSDLAGKWNPAADGYYVYRDVLPAGMQTEPLEIRIENVPEEATDAQDFHVVVVYESTPVQYDAEGNPYADWSMLLQSETVQGGVDHE